MIELTRLSGASFFINAEMIRSIEATPDTLLNMLGGDKIMVKESVPDVVAKFTEFKKRIHQEPPQHG